MTTVSVGPSTTQRPQSIVPSQFPIHPKIIDYSQQPDMPWKNKLGTTRELLTHPDDEEWRIRISMATITQDCAFSSFENVGRHFAVLEGAGVELTVGGEKHMVTPHSAALAFSGDESTSCRLLHGRSLDLNLMLRNETGYLRKIVTDSDTSLRLSASDLMAIKHLGVLAIANTLVLSYVDLHANKEASHSLLLKQYCLTWFIRPPQQMILRGTAWLIGITRDQQPTSAHTTPIA